MTECTTPDCANPTDRYLCNQCVNDLQAWIDQIPALLEELPAVIHRTAQTKPIGATGSSGGGADLAPINLDALQLQENLRMVNHDANTYADDKHAAGSAWLITDWVQKAERLINGPEPERVNINEIRQRIEGEAPPMPTRQLVPWLRKNAGISVKGKDVRNWAARGKIRPVQRNPLPTYWPHEVLNAYNETRAPGGF